MTLENLFVSLSYLRKQVSIGFKMNFKMDSRFRGNDKNSLQN
jgi:hypothetical protein